MPPAWLGPELRGRIADSVPISCGPRAGGLRPGLPDNWEGDPLVGLRLSRSKNPVFNPSAGGLPFHGPLEVPPDTGWHPLVLPSILLIHDD